jgi:hypothetical protein
MRHDTTNVNDESERIWEDEVMYYLKVLPGCHAEICKSPKSGYMSPSRVSHHVLSKCK